MMQETLSELRESFVDSTPNPETCAHYWVIAPPVDPVSKGICKICGAEKDFDNYLPSDSEWR